jgi:hypothetical protein
MEHRDDLDKISNLLIERETIDREEFEAILAGEDPAEVFREKDEKKAKKVEEEKRREQRRKAAREREQRERVPAPGAAAAVSTPTPEE